MCMCIGICTHNTRDLKWVLSRFCEPNELLHLQLALKRDVTRCPTVMFVVFWQKRLSHIESNQGNYSQTFVHKVDSFRQWLQATAQRHQRYLQKLGLLDFIKAYVPSLDTNGTYVTFKDFMLHNTRWAAATLGQIQNCHRTMQQLVEMGAFTSGQSQQLIDAISQM